MAFNPELTNWFPVSKFRFWCQKVLPLVYDDSLSYYEVLCKMVDYLNKYGEDLGVLAEDYKALVEWVNNYFEQDLDPIIKQYVDEWLDEHPEATTTVQDGSITVEKFHNSVVDKTLTESGHPADALVVGEIVRNPLDINKPSTADGNTFTIATYNVLGTNYWRYPSDPPCLTDRGLVAISRVIQEANPDIIGLQEVSKTPKYTPLPKLSSIGYTNTHYLGNRVVGYQNSQLGDAIMTKINFPLSGIVDTSWPDQADEKRHCIKCVVSINNKLVSIYTTHLSLNDARRASELADILAQINADTNAYKILMGDMNFGYLSTDYYTVANAGLICVNENTPTYIGTQEIIDYIFITNNITVNDYDIVANTDASDHALLWANLTLN